MFYSKKFKQNKKSIKNEISYKQSRQILKKSLIKIKDEYIRSDDSLNRVSSANIISTTNYPSANNTAFDGFACLILKIQRFKQK